MDHTIHTQELRATEKEYPVNMIYNMGETGLSCRMGPNHTYLLQNKDRAAVRGTEL